MRTRYLHTDKGEVGQTIESLNFQEIIVGDGQKFDLTYQLDLLDAHKWQIKLHMTASIGFNLNVTVGIKVVLPPIVACRPTNQQPNVSYASPLT